MLSMDTSHFLFCTIPAWGKNYHSLLVCLLEDTRLIYTIGHVRPFCALAARLVREQETIIVTFIVAPCVLDKTKTEISCQFLDKPLESSKFLQRIR